MKKSILFVLISIGFILASCSNVDNSSLNSLEKSTSTEKIEKNELELLGLSYGQSVKFDEFCLAYSENIDKIQEFNYKIVNEYTTLDNLSSTDILLEASLIESSYLDNGGKNQDGIVSFLQEYTFGFLNIAKNMYDYQREFTELEAHGNLVTALSFVNEIGENYGLDDDSVKTLNEYFLNNVSMKGNFIPAAKELINNL